MKRFGWHWPRVQLLPRTPRAWALATSVVIVSLVIYFALLEQFAPITSDAYVQSYVVQISPQVAGRVTEVAIEDNGFVQTGQLLFVLDPKPYGYRVSQLEAALELARREVEQLDDLRKTAAADLNVARADLENAKWRLAEETKLQEEGAASLQALQDVRKRASDSTSKLHRAQAELARVKSQIAAQIGGEHALIARAKAQLEKARYDLEQTRILAPTAGYVTNLQLAPGFYVKAGDAAMTFVDSRQRWLIANFRENSLAAFRSGGRAEFSVAMYPGRVFEASVESLGWGVDAGQGIPSGALPEVEAPSHWIRMAQRFPVRLTISETARDLPLRVGSSVTVAVYTRGNRVLDALSALWLRIGSYTNYLY